MSNNNLPIKDDSLRKLQKYIRWMNADRGFTESVDKKMILLFEEVGELAKAIRKYVGLKFDDTTTTKDIKEELADVQIVLLGLASMVNVDMFDAVIEKEKHNQTRNWK